MGEFLLLEFVGLILQALVPIGLLIVGGLVGSLAEKRHLADLARREQEVLHLLVTDVRRLPPGMTVSAGGTLVSGQVVVASDYLKRFVARLINLVGGEIGAFQILLDRGRREARLRMLDEARAAGADLVVNVRYTTTTIALGASEILCYGTGLHRTPGVVAQPRDSVQT